MDAVRSNSSADLPIFWKVHELVFLARNYAYGLIKGQPARPVLRYCDEYDRLLRKYANLPLKSAKVFEIGFGTRAGIMIALTSLGVDAYGVDLDEPILHGSLREIRDIYRKNGFERALKSSIRFYAFDLLWRRQFAQELKRRGATLQIPRNRLRVQDAASVDWPDHSLDLICSQAVFEHIPISSLQRLVPKMVRWLKPSGIASITPDIFTGISGGHLLEWFDLRKNRRRRSEPWEHLRKRRFHGNVYLNELTRAEYRRMFSQYFEILEENVLQPNQGREFYTPEVAEELKEYPEEEIFSNGVQFVLRPKPLM